MIYKKLIIQTIQTTQHTSSYKSTTTTHRTQVETAPNDYYRMHLRKIEYARKKKKLGCQRFILKWLAQLRIYIIVLNTP